MVESISSQQKGRPAWGILWGDGLREPEMGKGWNSFTTIAGSDRHLGNSSENFLSIGQDRPKIAGYARGKENR
ncbi:hypothetical protein [Geitlerinema sp. PCC 9228]|uniref:hypothetical protein n=1 Tax=Geitlerinema sp. PCC 9228 TaxID=111611 RepID=UPI001B8AA2FB|nr:hypothetical protein [Geitlerinema sp. PCC 9228]